MLSGQHLGRRHKRTLVLSLRQIKESSEVRKNECPMKPVKETKQLLQALPYELTGAQKKVFGELQADLCAERVMSRLTTSPRR